MTIPQKDTFLRSSLLLGDEAMGKMRNTKVIIFGVGGVGSWCAESLVRTGLTHVALVDSDRVCASNVNRQLMATMQTMEQPKVEAMRERLLTINPEADIVAIHKAYTMENSPDFHLEEYDYVIDAIDSLPDKAHLILTASGCSTLFSSMGAALKTDPTTIKVSEFWKVEGDPLARALRNMFRKNQTFPKRKFLCVHSTQRPLPNKSVCGTEKANGSLSQVTGAFGLTLASLTVNAICASSASLQPDAG